MKIRESHVVFSERQARRRVAIIQFVAYTAIAAIGIAGAIAGFKLAGQGGREIAATATFVLSIVCVIALFVWVSISEISYTRASPSDVQDVLEMLDAGLPNLEPIAKALGQGTPLANRDVNFAVSTEHASAPVQPSYTGMHVTLVELEFIELPSLPGAQAAMQKSYLLSMWDCTCRIATWDASAGCFEDSGGRLNPLAIRSWALLPQPLDAEAWGESIMRAALSGDTSRDNAGWLQPKYEPQST